MSFLTPLYALAGLAIALPILLHLIRKQPKKHQVFSSLMFLDSSTPRLTSARRIDQWLLLLLRSAAILLLALAFSRPYWNIPATTESKGVGVSRMLLLDVSASMRRNALWEDAQRKANEIIDQSNPTDTLSIYAFDQSLRPLLSINEALDTPLSQRNEKGRLAIKTVSPGWMPTDLGLALTTAADLLQSNQDPSNEAQINSSEIVVVTDFQQGTNLDKLADYSWPESMKVRIERVASKLSNPSSGNARASVIASNRSSKQPDERSQDDNTLRVLVSNDTTPEASGAAVSKSDNELFKLVWLDANRQVIDSAKTACRVPAGSNLVVSIPQPPEKATTLQLTGDNTPFDNDYYIAPSVQTELSLLCIDSNERTPEDSLAYFLKQIPLGSVNRKVTINEREPNSRLPWPAPNTTPLVIASHLSTAQDLQALNVYLDQGGHVLWVWDAPESKESIDYTEGLKLLTDGDSRYAFSEVSEAKVRQYSMLQQIDFRHPLFIDLADSKFNDYSKVRFWSHRSLALNLPEAWQILASFDDRSPALISRSQGAGKLWILLAGWQPSQSQLALSSKFVPLIAGLFRIASPQNRNETSMTVGEIVEWSSDVRIVDPNGNALVANNTEPMALAKGDAKEIIPSDRKSKPEASAYGSGEKPLATGNALVANNTDPMALATGDAKEIIPSDSTSKPEASAYGSREMNHSSLLTQPGLYTRYDADQKPTYFAVNLDESESLTAPAGLDRLDQYGIVVQDRPFNMANAVATQHLRAVELESKQGWWQWLLMGVLAVVSLESMLCIGKGF